MLDNDRARKMFLSLYRFFCFFVVHLKSRAVSLKPQISGLWTCDLGLETCDGIFEAAGM